MSRSQTFHVGTRSQLTLAKAVEYRIEALEGRRVALGPSFTEGDELADLYVLRITFCTACEAQGCEACARPDKA